jgi:tetratricopeptide (TPR) repeat protein
MTRRVRRQYYESQKTRQHEQQVQTAIEQAAAQLNSGDYEAAVRTCEAMLPLAVQRPFQRAELLNCIGTAQMLRENFDAAYDAFSETLTILPNDPYLWYNRGVASRFTMRSGQALRDCERAVQLEGNGSMAAQYAQALQASREHAQHNMALRGPHFTLEQLIEQEELFQQAIAHMAAEQWADAEEMLRRVIALGDGLPQPWSNMGACLAMQQRHNEAEAAYQRALDIDPANEAAHYNLEQLQTMRQHTASSPDTPPTA